MQWVVEDCLCLDIYMLVTTGLFDSARYNSRSIRWSNGCSIRANYLASGSQLELKYDLNGEPNPQKVRISKAPCHFGGFRYYFHCPGCGSRRCKLHSASSGFYCRDCYQLPYYSQVCGHIEGITHKIQRLERKLEGLSKYTRSSTVQKLEDKLEAAELAWSDAMIGRFGRFECVQLGLVAY